ncbi:hypothetical protein MMC10_004709 [Thelotrema lepadinum]|nr:hypothetical protein [Thelotrema lepadinum]
MDPYLFRFVLIALLFQQSCFIAAKPLISKKTNSISTRQVYQFPNGSWAENIAVRPNGNLLITRIDVPELYQIDPSSPNSTAEIVFSFPALATLGIAETSPDKFAIVAGNCTLAGSQTGSYSIWSVDFGNQTQGKAANVAKIVDIPEGQFLNGLSKVNDHTVVVGDIFAGVIYGVNIKTGKHYVASTDPAIAAVPGAFVGVNGIRAKDGFLYFVNSGSNVFGRFPIGADGKQTGNSSIIATVLEPYQSYDDFTYNKDGNFYLVTGGGNSIEEVTPGGQGQIIVGSQNSTVLAEPTSAHFGRGAKDRGTLYITTAGDEGYNNEIKGIVGAQVVAVDLSGRSSK